MAVQVRDSTANSQNNPPNPTVTVPATVVAGDLLIAFHTADLDAQYSGMNTPAGWSQIGSPPVGADTTPQPQPCMEIFYKTAEVSDLGASVTFVDSAGANGSVVLVAVFGHDPVEEFVAAPTYGFSATATTVHRAPSVTGAVGGLLLTAHCADTGGTQRTYTPPTGMAELQDTSISGGYIATSVNVLALSSASATGNKDATCSASCKYITASLVVAPAAAPPAGNKGAAFLSLLAA